MTYRFSGSYRNTPKLHNNGKRSWGPRGILRAMRDARRLDALARSSKTPHDCTKAHRMNRCDKSCVAA